jgi:hypothetical protein
VPGEDEDFLTDVLEGFYRYGGVGASWQVLTTRTIRSAVVNVSMCQKTLLNALNAFFLAVLPSSP